MLINGEITKLDCISRFKKKFLFNIKINNENLRALLGLIHFTENYFVELT